MVGATGSRLGLTAHGSVLPTPTRPYRATLAATAANTRASSKRLQPPRSTLLHPQHPQPGLPVGGVGLGLLGADWAAQVECEAEHFNPSHPLGSVARVSVSVSECVGVENGPSVSVSV